jgi:hypothetical protein
VFQTLLTRKEPGRRKLDKLAPAQSGLSFVFIFSIMLQNTRRRSFQDDHCGHLGTSFWRCDPGCPQGGWDGFGKTD